jgi:excisionase family DNA binding protein
MMTVQEAAVYLRISRDLAYKLVATGQLPHVRLGRTIRVPRFGLEQWIARTAGLPLSEPVTVTSAKPREH